MLSTLSRFVLKLIFAVFAVIFGVGVLAVALLMLAVGLLTSLVTGRKPAPAMAFGRFQRFSAQGIWPGGMNGMPPGAAADPREEPNVVDVEVREVRDDKRLP